MFQADLGKIAARLVGRSTAFAALLAVAIASDAKAAQFTLKWADNATNESGFKIERSSNGSTFSEIATTAANVVSYVDANLPNATTYWYRLRAFNSAGTSGYSNTVSGKTPTATTNTAPTISSVASATIPEDGSTGARSFTVGDGQTSATSLTLSATSSNTTLVPAANITFGGSGSSRTVTVRPAANLSGASTITVRVSDGSLTASSAFTVTVTAVNDAPTVSGIASRTISAGTSSGSIPFTVGDAETAAGSLTVSASSSNATLLPSAAIVIGGSGANRTLTLTPPSGATGTATVTVRVSDGSLATSTSFSATVTATTTATATALTFGDVGSPAIAGSQTISGTTIQVRGGGTDIWNTRDQFRFGRQSITGNAEVTVRLTGLTRTNDWAKAGLMFRTSTDASAAYVFVFLTPSNGVALQYRSSAGASASHKLVEAASIPKWLKLTRSGDTFYAYHSANGTTWDMVDSVTVDLPNTALAGLAVTSHNASLATTATFENLKVANSTVAPAPTPTNTAPTISSIATQTIAMNGTSSAVGFTIGDAQTSASNLTLSATSSNTTLIPTANITFGGSGANRTVTVRPLSNSTGSSTITIRVSDGSLSTSTSFIANVAPALTSSDIGSPAIAGNTSISGTKTLIRAGGTDIWGAADQFHFARQSVQGDTELTVRVAGLTNSNEWAKAGLMFRTSTNANAAFVLVFMTPSRGVVLQYRSSAGATARQKYAEAATLPRWLKLTRSGDTFYAFHSANGATWDLVDSVTVDLPDTALAGLAVTSHNAGAATTATFENLKID